MPGGREISWPKLRALLGVNRMSMPDAATAKDVTGYERGTITPFGSLTAWPVVADATVAGRLISIGAGAHGVAATAQADDVVARPRRPGRRRHRPGLNPRLNPPPTRGMPGGDHPAYLALRARSALAHGDPHALLLARCARRCRSRRRRGG